MNKKMYYLIWVCLSMERQQEIKQELNRIYFKKLINKLNKPLFTPQEQELY